MVEDKVLAGLSNSLGNLTINSPNVNLIQQELNFYRSRLALITSDYWLVPKNQIAGISGYFCERCQVFEQEFVRDIGYDKTAQARHWCDEDKVKSKHKLSTNSSDIAARDDIWARILLNSINSLNPNLRYLIATDVSYAFNVLASSFDFQQVNMLMGIPDRYCLYQFHESARPDWINRALANLDKKIAMEESEIIDFLKRTKSTYAAIEVSTKESFKIIRVMLVA